MNGLARCLDKTTRVPGQRPKELHLYACKINTSPDHPAVTGVIEMTRDEYIFKNAPQIAEQRIRAARVLQAKEAERRWKRALAEIKGWGIRNMHGL
ncbi:hypothetical protein [Ruegeria arenilitoris]|uniref:hypothetical protein n=1 Tax=Ruegeria arenilitoris TaxID=1173585 RepID=UPI00147DF12B|nr:hypothetical protein [Ruegeria arenilitoris]